MEISLNAQGKLWGAETSALGEKSTCPLITAAQARKLLRVSLRQLYRYIKDKRLRPAGKFMNQWVFKEKDVADFVRPRPGLGAHAPSCLKPVFWSYRLKDIDPSAHAPFIAAQILQYGGMGEICWANQRYGLAYLKKIAEETRWVDSRTKNFWKLIHRAA